MSTNTVDPSFPQAPEPKKPTKSLTLIFAILGGLILLGLIVGTSLYAFNSLSRTQTVLRAATSDLAVLEVEANAGEFALQFGDVTEAELDVRSARRGWSMERQGKVLVVDAPDGWMQWCVFGCEPSNTNVVLTLPEALNNGELDVQLDLSAGAFEADGNFNALNLEMGAGRLDARGAARTVNLSLGAGHASFELADVETAELEVSAGRLDGTLSGTAPRTVHGEISAGMLDLTLPTASYDVNVTQSAGSVDNRLAADPSSAHQITLDVSAGSAVLRPGS